ncbi:MAG: type II toxin-antitoxin system Phd/YefM family antitoxin [Acidobacteria bacterium]|nr:type II toxin-antitoxin system Phd/YefM family antitoxin [Acidobacteriota bacterium]
MKTRNLCEVKNNLCRIVERLPQSGPVLITKDGRTRAVLLPVDEDTDLESLLLSQNNRLWELIDASFESGRRGRLKSFEDLPETAT